MGSRYYRRLPAPLHDGRLPVVARQFGQLQSTPVLQLSLWLGAPQLRLPPAPHLPLEAHPLLSFQFLASGQLQLLFLPSSRSPLLQFRFLLRFVREKRRLGLLFLSFLQVAPE